MTRPNYQCLRAEKVSEILGLTVDDIYAKNNIKSPKYDSTFPQPCSLSKVMRKNTQVYLEHEILIWAKKINKKISSMEELTSELDRSKTEENERHKIGNAISVELTNKILLTETEIVNQSIKYNLNCGIYFLIKNNKVVYVGQSVNIYKRISEHQNYKQFDRIAFILFPADLLDKMESLYIHLIRPPLNISVNGRLCSPISLNDLFN